MYNYNNIKTYKKCDFVYFVCFYTTVNKAQKSPPIVIGVPFIWWEGGTTLNIFAVWI